MLGMIAQRRLLRLTVSRPCGSECALARVLATGRGHGKPPGSRRTGPGRFDGDSTLVGEDSNTLFARAYEIEEIDALVDTRLFHTKKDQVLFKGFCGASTLYDIP